MPNGGGREGWKTDGDIQRYIDRATVELQEEIEDLKVYIGQLQNEYVAKVDSYYMTCWGESNVLNLKFDPDYRDYVKEEKDNA